MPVEHQLWQVKVGKDNLFYFVPSASNVPKETQEHSVLQNLTMKQI